VPTRTAEIATPASPKRINFENLVAFIGFAVVLISAVFWADRPIIVERKDFSVTYLGCRMVYLGQASKLYDLAEQLKEKRSLFKDAPPLIYEHPPFEALLLSPLGALPYNKAYMVWGLINVAIWLYVPFLLRPYAPTPRDELGYLTLWLLFAPLGVTLFQGQSSLVMLLVYEVVFVSLKQGRDFRAGAILGLGLFKFQFILPFAVIFLLRRQWTFMKGFLLTAAALGVLSVVAVGWPGIWSYIHLLATIASHPDNMTYGAARDMATLQGFMHAVLGKLLDRSAITFIVAAMSGALIGWGAWCWRAIDDGRRGRTFDLMFAVSVVVALVAGFHMFTHDLSPLLLAMLLVAGHFPGRDRPALRFTLGATLVAFWIPASYFVLLAWHCFYLWFLVLMIFMMDTLKLAEIPAKGEPIAMTRGMN